MIKKVCKFSLLSGLLLVGVSIADEKEEAKKAISKESQPQEVLIHFERDYVLLKKHQLEVENTLSYIYYSANQVYLNSFAILDPVFLTLGKFGIETNRRHIFVDSVSLRYGILDNLQFEINVPIMYRTERASKTGTNEEITRDKFGLGDISFALSYQPIKERGKIPALITSISYKTTTGKSPFKLSDPKKDLPTGSGYNSIKIGLNILKTIDPVVVFGGIAYSYNQDVSVNKLICGDTGCGYLEKVYPGDTLSVNLGFAYALSYNFSMNFQYLQDYTFTTKSKVNGNKFSVANSTLNSASFKVGTGWALSDRLSVNIGLSIGMTSDAPDYNLEIRIPYRF